MKRWLTLTLASALLSAFACNDPVAPDPAIGNVAETPTECIWLVEVGVNGRELGCFLRALSPEFAYYFEPDLVGYEVNGYTVPESWGYAEEERAIGNMLRPYEEGGAYSIFIRIPDGDVGAPPDDADTYTDSDVRFEMEIMYDEENEYETYFWNTHEFSFEKITRDGISFWRITEWKDIHSWGYASMSYVKAYYYALDPLPES